MYDYNTSKFPSAFRTGKITFHGTVIAGIGNIFKYQVFILLRNSFCICIAHLKYRKCCHSHCCTPCKLYKAVHKRLAAQGFMSIFVVKINDFLIHINLFYS